MQWTPAQKTAFVEMHFDAQHAYCQEHYAGAAFNVILVDGQPAGRLYVAREDDEIRIVDIALLPETATAASGRRCCATSIRGGRRRQAAAHPRRTLQSRARLDERLGSIRSPIAAFICSWSGG